ncbi:MAG: hypothetical protein K6G17_02935 [Oscillospiraceae bacterium]|nr:hypothetical protein [Oscillospiraceae bacterium]
MAPAALAQNLVRRHGGDLLFRQAGIHHPRPAAPGRGPGDRVGGLHQIQKRLAGLEAPGVFADDGDRGRLAVGHLRRRAAGFDLNAVLKNNDAYHALKAIDGLIVTGPTGTNVNDIAIALLDTEEA